MSAEGNAGPWKGEAPQVLIVDDEKDFVLSLEDILESRGYRVEKAHSPKTACEKLNRFDAQVALLDIRLGGEISGEDILHQIRSNPRFDKTRVIVITAYPSMAETVTNLADLILIKPVEVEQLASGIGVSYIFRFLADQKPFKGMKAFEKLMQSTEGQPPQRAGRTIITAYNKGFAELEIGLKIFVEACALTAINQVQTLAAYGGKVFILGGNARRTLPLFEKYFMPIFDNPYVHADKLRATDACLVKEKNIGTMGAASLVLRPELYHF